MPGSGKTTRSLLVIRTGRPATSISTAGLFGDAMARPYRPTPLGDGWFVRRAARRGAVHVNGEDPFGLVERKLPVRGSAGPVRSRGSGARPGEARRPGQRGGSVWPGRTEVTRSRCGGGRPDTPLGDSGLGRLAPECHALPPRERREHPLPGAQVGAPLGEARGRRRTPRDHRVEGEELVLEGLLLGPAQHRSGL